MAHRGREIRAPTPRRRPRQPAGGDRGTADRPSPGRQTDDELTLFKSLGLAVEDLAAASLAVDRARAEGLGQTIPF